MAVDGQAAGVAVVQSGQTKLGLELVRLGVAEHRAATCERNGVGLDSDIACVAIGNHSGGVEVSKVTTDSKLPTLTKSEF